MGALANKTCLVTGGSSGIGLEVARGLAEAGARVVIVGRDAERTASAVAAISAVPGHGGVSGLLGDLSVQADVRRVVREFQAAHDRLDVLVNNAGAIFAKRRVTADGLEATFALNHLGYFLLTRELLPLLVESRPARVINVASAAHFRGRLDFEDLMGARRYDGWRAYAASKLANVMFTYELARRLAGTGVTVNCLHPGVVASGFARSEPGLLGWVFRLITPTMISAREGAATVLYLATSQEVEGVSGLYFDRCRAVGSSRASQDPVAARRLWEESERLTGRV